MNKHELFECGLDIMNIMCLRNNIVRPRVKTYDAKEWQFGRICAYYRKDVIHICLARCAAIGVAGRAWSFPGYVVDRTPYGVIQHELGHHIDWNHGTIKRAYWSDYSTDIREETGEQKITTYCPNDAEWFAEIFRLFVTNPDLLKRMRPKTFARLISDGHKPVFNDTWVERLNAMGALERTIKAAGNKIK